MNPINPNAANVAPYYQPGHQSFQRGPLVKPIDSCWRNYYETGRTNFNVPGLPTVAFESQAFVSKQPCWLTMVFAAFDLVAAPLYVLLFDINPADPAQLSLVVPGTAFARFSFGPVPAGTSGTLLYEASAELIPVPYQGAPQGGPEKPWAYGLPFNFGVTAVASSTPRVYTQPVNPNCMALTCRVQS
jgi:hypothetical protein